MTAEEISVYRLVNRAYKDTAFTGVGCTWATGRWNYLMNIMVYTSQTTSLAVNEVLANVDYPDLLDDEMLLYEATIPAGMKIEEVTKQDLPRNWQRWDPPPRALKELGRVWIESLKSPVLKVPSALVPWESNYLLNPSHPDFKKIRVLPPKRFSMLRYK